MHRKPTTDLGTRKDRLLHEHIHDPYKTPRKLAEPTVCPECGAIYHDGRWQWTTPLLMDANRETCQACHRTRDKYPAGIITLTGSFVTEHQEEIVSIARSNELHENQEHPLHRIMKIEPHPDSLVITTTDIHLPHRIGEALHDAFKGELEVNYDKEGYFVRVNWRRSD